LNLPPATTFEQGQRKLYGVAAGVAGVAFGLAVLVGGWIVVFGKWGPALLPTQLYILAGLLAVGCINTTIVIVGLLVGGPVGKLSGKVSDGQRTVEIDATGNGQ
jgi:hypothetical protein